jgi:hypothetical protein
MSLWMVIVLLGLVKLPVAALMLWIPFREDQAMRVVSPAMTETDGSGDSEDDGGSVALPASPLHPRPRSPRPRPRRRGPHGSDATPPLSPPRIRRPVTTPARRIEAQRLRLR